MLRGEQPRYVGVVRHAGELVDLAPALAAVLGDLHQTVVGAEIEKPFLLRRLGERQCVAVERRRLMAGDGVRAPYFAEHGQLVTVELPRQVGADRLPGVAAVVAAEEFVGREVDARAGMRADEQRRIPVPAQGRLTLSRLRLDANALPGAAIVARQDAVLQFAVDGVGVFWIDARLEAIAAEKDKPVTVGDAVDAAIARRAADGVVVLGAAVDVVERCAFIHGDVIELRYWQVGDEPPVGGLVMALVDAAVAADEIVIGVVGVDPQAVIVHVAEFGAEVAQRFAAVVGNLAEDIHEIDALGIFRIDDQVSPVHGLALVLVLTLPGFAGVTGSENAPLLVDRLDDGIDHVGIRRRAGQANAAKLLTWQTVGQLTPRLAAVGRFVQAAFRAAVDHRPHVPAALVGGGDEHVGIARIEHNIGYAGVVADVQYALPGPA